MYGLSLLVLVLVLLPAPSCKRAYFSTAKGCHVGGPVLHK